jgi:hypothetical protein
MQRRGDWLQTYSGRRFWPFDPRPEDVCLEDVAHALAMQCRYGGHCRRFYSVAEHSVLMAYKAPEPLKRWALLHDGSEAYIQDMNRSIKKGFPAYKMVERPVQRAVYQHFGMDPDGEPPEIKTLDMRIVLDERAHNMTPTDDVWQDYDGLEPLGAPIQFWDPQKAEEMFLRNFRILFGGSSAKPDLYA